MPPLISAILPVYNREAMVSRAIESVLCQSYGPVELIVIDDGSTDGTADVIRQFGSRITLVTQAHAGAYVARNRGLQEASGQFVAFIDSDDAWLPDRLRTQMPLMERETTGLVFGDTTHVSPEGSSGTTSFRTTPPHRGRVAQEFAWANFVPMTTVLVRRRCLDEVGGFPVMNPLSADYLTWFRVALRNELDYVDSPVAEYMVHAGGMSADLGRSLEARIALFSGELSSQTDASTRATLSRLLFNLSQHLALAAARGRAPNVARPFRLAWRTAWSAAGLAAGPWAAAFAIHQVRVRTRRLFS